MTKQKYIGIENELDCFREDENIKFKRKDFKKIMGNVPYILEDKRVIRTHTGNKYYIDGEVIEITTPPIVINYGFATRLTDSLIIGRNHVIKNTPNNTYTGYSMHWNISQRPTVSFQEDMAIPFQLFGLTPLSCGYGIRRAGNGRTELLGDSLIKEDQINALALLIGSYALAKEKYNFPLKILGPVYEQSHFFLFSAKYNHNVRMGRYTEFKVRRRNDWFLGKSKDMQAQQILELFYDWLSPFVYKLGERNEINNLEAFVKGEKKLEIDDIKYFYMLNKKSGTENGTYRPINIQTQNGERSPVISMSTDTKKIPLEGRLLGKLATAEEFGVICIDWNYLSIIENNGTRKIIRQIKGIDNIYTYLEQFSRRKNPGTLEHSNVMPRPITKEKYDSIDTDSEKIMYNPDTDLSAEVDDIQIFNYRLMKTKIKNALSENIKLQNMKNKK